MELLKASKDRQALQFVKKLGMHIHAKRKCKELSSMLAAMGKAAASTEPLSSVQSETFQEKKPQQQKTCKIEFLFNMGSIKI